MARCLLFSFAFSPVLAACSAAADDVCPDVSDELDETHEVLLLQVESTWSRTGRAMAAEAEDSGTSLIGKSEAASSASARAAVAQIPGYSAVLVTEDTFPTINAIAANEYEGNVGPERCHQPLPEGDDTRPFEDVLAENPNVTGWCHYGSMGGWLSTCGAALEAESYVGVAVQYGANTVHGSLDENELAEEYGVGAPHNVLGYQGDRFFTDYRYLAWDSLYCLDNGFLDQSRYSIEAVHDFARMTEMAQEFCDEVLEEFPDMWRYTMSDLMQHAGINQNILADEANLPFGLRTLQRPSAWNNRRHAAWKCVLGGLGCDISNCAYSYCLLDTPAGLGPFIGHGVQCREDWLLREDVQEYVDAIGNGADIP